MITEAKTENGMIIAEGMGTNNNRCYRYIRTRRSMKETEVSFSDCERNLVTYEAEIAGKQNAFFSSVYLPEVIRGKCQKEIGMSWRQNLNN